VVNVSVIIPCFNSEKTIRETLESVFAQTYQDFEVIVVDDGSTDRSAEIVQSFNEKIEYIYQNNGGQSAARNTGIRAARGKYLAFLDADDLWYPEKLEKQIAFMKSKGVDWCYCDCELFSDRSGKSFGKYSQRFYSPKAGWIAKDLMMGNSISSPTPIVSREIIEKAGYFNESREIRSREDWEEWIRIALVSKIVYFPEVLAKYRIHEKSITYGEDPNMAFAGHLAVINNLCDRFPNELGQARSTAISHYAAIFSKTNFLQKEYPKAKTLISIAINLNPLLKYKLLALFYSLPQFFLNSLLSLRSIIRRGA
jgi:glycosyltransferase involved in cell wall biosynthesis